MKGYASNQSVALSAQDYAQASRAQNNINAQQQAALNDWPLAYQWHREPMTASDLGIVDQNLDDKIGMEPNPLNGTRLWDNS